LTGPAGLEEWHPRDLATLQHIYTDADQQQEEEAAERRFAAARQQLIGGRPWG
jgi:siderophore synthetase component